MGSGKLIVGEPIKGPSRGGPDLTGALKVLALFAFIFAGASVIDIGLAIVPANLGAPDSRFVAFAGMAGSLPLLAIGVLGLELAAFNLSRNTLRIATVLATVGALVSLVGLIATLTSYGPTLAAAQAQNRQIVNMTAIRSVSSYVFFGSAFVYGAWMGWRRVLRPEHI